MKIKAPLTFYYCGYEKCTPGQFFGPAIRAHHLVHFVISGKGIYRIGKKEFHIEKNHGFLIHPKEVTYYEADATNPWEYIWLAFDGIEADRILEQYDLTPQNYKCVPEDANKLNSYLQQSLNCFKNAEHSQTEIAGWFYLFFSCLQCKKIDIAMGKDKILTQAALEYMRNNYMYDINIDGISAQIGIDRTYLYKLCKKYTNTSPKEFLTARRIDASKNMLWHSENTITEIALSCGFHDSSSFCKTFRQYENQSPSDYQKSMQKIYEPQIKAGTCENSVTIHSLHKKNQF